MRTLLRNIRYLWKHEIKNDMAMLAEGFISQASYEADDWNTGEYITHSTIVGDWNPVQQALNKKLSGEISTFQQQVLDMDVHEFFKTYRVPYLTSNAHKLMRHLEIERVEQLVGWSARKLKTYGIGWKTIDYIRYMLGKHGLKLKGDL